MLTGCPDRDQAFFSTVPGVATSSGRSEHRASLMLVWEQRNSVNHLFSIEIDGATYLPIVFIKLNVGYDVFFEENA